MKALFATCGLAALAILVGACERSGPHGPPKQQSPAPAQSSTAGGYPSTTTPAAIALASGPHGPPRILQRPNLPTEPLLADDIDDAGSPEVRRITPEVRDCKFKHLRKFRAAEKQFRSDDLLTTGQGGEVEFLEAWLDSIIRGVYSPDIVNPSPLPPDPNHLIPNCVPY